MLQNIEKHIDEILTRGVVTFVDPEGAFKKKLIEDPNSVVIKFGVDVTSPDMHIGHAVVLRMLRKFQDLGCKVIFVLGDFTTLIGDPTGKSKTRPMMEKSEKNENTGVALEDPKYIPFLIQEADSKEKTTETPRPTSDEIERNMKTYLEQVGKILLVDEKHFSWIKNSDWFTNPTDVIPGKDAKVTISIDNKEKSIHQDISIDPNSIVGKAVLFENSRMQKTQLKSKRIVTITLHGLIWTLQKITHGRLIQRDMFQDRINKNEELFMHEMLYPVIQGIDSFAIHQIFGRCDLEVGGSDQVFNLLMGREVMRMNKQEPQAVLAFELLVGLDGKEKMSKSLGNYVGITDAPEDMYGKIMSVPDALIGHYFTLCTYTPTDEVLEIKKDVASGDKNPKDFKMRLAREIVAIYHGEAKSQEAEQDFITKFQKKEIPDNIPEIEGSGELSDLLVKENIIESKSEWRRLVEAGAVTNLTTDAKVTDPRVLSESGVYRIGKHRFVKVK